MIGVVQPPDALLSWHRELHRRRGAFTLTAFDWVEDGNFPAAMTWQLVTGVTVEFQAVTTVLAPAVSMLRATRNAVARPLLLAIASDVDQALSDVRYNWPHRLEYEPVPNGGYPATLFQGGAWPRHGRYVINDLLCELARRKLLTWDHVKTKF